MKAKTKERLTKELEKRIDDLEKRNKELLDKALHITEGKETA